MGGRLRLPRLLSAKILAGEVSLEGSRIVTSDLYEVKLGIHVFPTMKFRLVRERLLKEGVSSSLFVEAPMASDAEVLLVHERSYMEKLKRGALSAEEIARLELPYSEALVRASWVCVGGTRLACEIALKRQWAMHLGGGFHHAFADHGEGFCVLNDMACAIRSLQQRGMVRRVLVVDLDLHQGNGTASIFKTDPSVYTFSMHEENNYPFFKVPSRWDIGLPTGTGDGKYLTLLQEALSRIGREWESDLLLYQAGADPYCEDQLGGLSLTLEGLRKRDEEVFEFAERKKIPVCVVLGGGYALHPEDTVSIHAQTARSLLLRAGCLHSHAEKE